MVVHSGGGSRPWVCYDGPSAGDAQWVLLGTTTGLDDDYVIHGDANGGTGHNDTINAGPLFATSASDCQPDGGPGSWSALAYNGHFLDVEGDGGDDRITGFAGDTISYGEAGEDYIEVYTCVAGTHGDGGADGDELVGIAGSCENYLAGAGSDCIDDINNSHSLYSCGADTDSYQEDDSPNFFGDCENFVSSC